MRALNKLAYLALNLIFVAAVGFVSCSDDSDNKKQSTDETQPSGGSDQSQPSGGSEQSQPSGGSEQSQPSGGSEQSQPSGGDQNPDQNPDDPSNENPSNPNNDSAYDLTVKAGGMSGNGWGSRYWDCCKPHCAWKDNASPYAKSCDSNMNVLDPGATSVCDGGTAGTCGSQAPWAVSDTLAFGYAAVPQALGGECGKCLLLTFDGTSHDATDERTASLKGKQMVIMVSNTGGDVGSGQFDIMIPGGGLGWFNGCSNQLGIEESQLGERSGGLIATCQNSNQSAADIQKCVKEKCSVYNNYPDLKAGCEFSAAWYAAADNPRFKFEELETCPADLVSKY